MNGVMPAGRHGSRVKDLTYLTRVCESLAGGPGISVKWVNEALEGTD